MDDMNTDDIIAAMQQHDLEGATKLTPREYGRLRGVVPQLVYYHIRQGHIDKEVCLCGRPVIDVDKADQYFKKGIHADGADQAVDEDE